MYSGVVTSLDGDGKPVVTKLDKPSFSPVQHSPNAAATVFPSNAAATVFPSNAGGPFEVSIRFAPNARLGEYRAYVTFLGARESSIKNKFNMVQKEYKFKVAS